jgi:hypothetical protein
LFITEKFVDEFHQKTSVLKLEVFHTKPTSVLWCLNSIPGHQAARPMAGLFTGPEESTTTLINGFDDSLRDVEGRHVMEGQSTENRSAESETPGPIKERRPPTR